MKNTMRLTSISLANYRSLQSVSIRPHDLSLLVGANASGKSNFADSFAFLADVYRDGLEIAVQRAGGYEGIAFRRMRRTKLPISIRTEVEIDNVRLPARIVRDPKELPHLRIEHRFAIKALTEQVTADYVIASEEITVYSGSDNLFLPILEIRRIADRIKVEFIDQELETLFVENRNLRQGAPTRLLALYWYFSGLSDLESIEDPEFRLPSTDLMITQLSAFTSAFRSFSRAMSAIQVHQINVSAARTHVAPSPNAELSRNGLNLPATINYLKRHHPDAWDNIIALMQRVLPNLSNIEVRNAPDRMLGLVFFEEGFRRPWGVNEVSDGTVQMLAMLVAILDPRTTLDIIEEPENSVHPWLIRVFLDACREAAKSKQILLTSHSPVLIDEMPPENVFVIWRRAGSSHILPLTSLDGYVAGRWQSGKIRLFEYLDSGIVPETVPPPPELPLLSFVNE